MKYLSIVVLFSVFLPVAALGQSNADVVYKPLAGEFCPKIDTQPRPELSKATQSVSLLRVDTDEQLGCRQAENDQTVEMCVTVATADLPFNVQARAWENPDCSGENVDSVNVGTLQLGAPGVPVLIP